MYLSKLHIPIGFYELNYNLLIRAIFTISVKKVRDKRHVIEYFFLIISIKIDTLEIFN